MTDVERFKQIVALMTDLFAKKNANYGNSFEKLYNELGPISGLVPLHNKLDRLTNLIKGGHNDFESIEDTLIDLANYAIMNVIEIHKANEKRKPAENRDAIKSKETVNKVILNENVDIISEKERAVSDTAATEEVTNLW